MPGDNTGRRERLEKIIEIIRKFGKTGRIKERLDPDDFAGTNWNQNEEEYQKEQALWLESVKKRKKNKGS